MRLVVKVGTSLVAPGGRVDTVRMRTLIDQLDLSRHQYLIVSSGAIAAGMSNLGLGKKPTSVPLMQACAAVGQSVLMHTYERLFFGKKVVAQLLLSSDDFNTPIRYKNLQNTLQQLLKLGVVPVVNENDSVSVRELEGAFGDNDELSALLAAAVKAVRLNRQAHSPAAYGAQAHPADGSFMQRPWQARPRRHAFQVAGCEIGE
jgi:glutamate 5-kinase